MTLTKLYTRIVRWLSCTRRRLFRQGLYPPPVVIGLLPDEPQWAEQGLLPVDKLYEPLPVQIPAWDYENLELYEVKLQVYWDTDPDDDAKPPIYEKVWPGIDFPTLPAADLRFILPKLHLTAGRHWLHYKVTEWSNNSSYSAPQPVTIDLLGPALAADQGPLQFETSAITFGYLASHGDKVTATLKSYRGGEPGDTVTWYWSRDPFAFTDDDIVSTRTLAAAEIGNPVTLVFDGNIIRARGDGMRFAFYRLADRAGNVSSNSMAFRLDVAAQPIPRVLPPPRIKGAPGGANASTLNPLTATNGAFVTIPAQAVILPGDVIVVQWAEPGSTGAYLTDQPEAANPREFRIPPDRIPQHFGKTIPVYYEVTEPGVAAPHVSAKHGLSVSRINGFPTVQCDKVSGGQLPLSSIPEGGHAGFTLGRWSFMATDQFVNIEVHGVDAANKLVVIQVLSEYPVPSVGATMSAGRISKADLRRFKIGVALDIKVHVSFDQKVSWQRFPSLTPPLSN